MLRTRTVRCALAIVTLTAIDVVRVGADAAEPNLSLEIYGFAEADAIYDTDRVDPDWVDAFRPSKIAVDPGQFGSDGQSSVSVKQSRFGVQGNVPNAPARHRALH